MGKGGGKRDVAAGSKPNAEILLLSSKTFFEKTMEKK